MEISGMTDNSLPFGLPEKFPYPNIPESKGGWMVFTESDTVIVDAENDLHDPEIFRIYRKPLQPDHDITHYGFVFGKTPSTILNFHYQTWFPNPLYIAEVVAGGEFNTFADYPDIGVASEIYLTHTPIALFTDQFRQYTIDLWDLTTSEYAGLLLNIGNGHASTDVVIYKYFEYLHSLS